jgi:hypothetical protein
MAEVNLVEIEYLRKERIILELIKNTSFCCIVWKQTIEPGQYTADTRNSVTLGDGPAFDFYISQINSGIYLDIFVDCVRLTTYSSLEYPDLSRLYDTIVGIESERDNDVKEAIQAFQNVERVCGILYTDYARGGVVVGGMAEDEVVFKGREGGVVVGGHAPYNQEPVIAEGGAVVGGEAKVTPYNEETFGGVVTGGSAFDEFILPSGGGVVAGGSALFETLFTGVGGVVAGGSASCY